MSRPKFARKDIREIIGEPCTEEMETRLIALYRSVVDPILDELSDAQAKAEKLETVQKELDGLKANNGDTWKAKFEAADKKLKNIEAAQTAKETKTAKEKAARAYLEGKSITGENLDIAMMAVSGLIDGLDLDGENIKDTKSLDDLVSGKLARLVVTQRENGANPANPPQNPSSAPKTRAEVYEKDDKGRFKLDASQRQEALAKIIANEQKG